jgi:hypothetical protein
MKNELLEIASWYPELDKAAAHHFAIEIFDKAKEKAKIANAPIFIMFDYGCAYFEELPINPRDIILKVDP